MVIILNYAYLFTGYDVAKSHNLHLHLLAWSNSIFCYGIRDTGMVEQTARQGEDAMGDRSQMAVNREVVVSTS
jgi:hypothetical protein